MGLFDFFKKKDRQQPNEPETPRSALFTQINRYSEYIMKFVHMRVKDSFAPISAFEKNNGEIVGFLYTTDKDNSYSLSVEEVLDRMEKRFEQELANNEIKSYVILYHSQFNNDDNHTLATDNVASKAITVAYHFSNADSGKIALRYTVEDNRFTFHPFSNFSREENDIILGTKLVEGKNYFQAIEVFKAPSGESNAGLKITKSNTRNIGDTWAGMFGFESFRARGGADVFEQYFIRIMNMPAVYTKGSINVSQKDFGDVYFKTVRDGSESKTMLPVIKTEHVFEVENSEIDEWENVDNLEAVIKGKGRDTFLVSYFATDYTENRDLYLSTKKHAIKLSGIVFMLNIYDRKPNEDGVKFSDDFTAYMPNHQLLHLGCFDFIGELEDFRETRLLDDGSLKGYILKVRLITHPDIADFFTIDMFVNPENMSFEKLTKGMRLTGLAQLQGRIVGKGE